MASSGNGRGIGSTTRHRQVDIQVDLQIASERCRPITHRLFSRSTITALSAIQFQPSSRLWPTIWSTFDRFSNRLSNSTTSPASLLSLSSTKMPGLGWRARGQELSALWTRCPPNRIRPLMRCSPKRCTDGIIWWTE